MRYSKINLTILLSLIISFSTAIAKAQENGITFTMPGSLYNMYKTENYLGVNHKLNSGINEKDNDRYPISIVDSEFLKIESAYRSGDKDIKSKIFEYKESNHDPLYTQRIELMLADIYVAEGDFDEAEKIYDGIDSNKLSSQDKEDYIINKSILLFNKGEYAKAEEELTLIAAKKSSNRIPALFYLACANYAQKDYAQAEEEFLACKDDKTFGESANYYLANIYFATNRYEEALLLGDALLCNETCTQGYILPLKKICGESAFALGNSESAIQYLKEYVDANSNDNRAMYI